MAKLTSTSIEQNREYIKQLKKDRTKQLRKEIKILDDEKSFRDNDITTIETDEEFKDESEDIYQIYLKMGILKPAEKTEGQKWLEEINKLLKEKIVNIATIDNLTKILYKGSYWDFEYKSFQGYRDAIQKGEIPKADDTRIDSIIKSIMKDISYLNLTPMAPSSRITEIQKLFDRSLEVKSFLDRQKAILEDLTKSNPEKDMTLVYTGNPNKVFNFNEYTFKPNTEIEDITKGKNIFKDNKITKPIGHISNLSEVKRIKFDNVILDKATKVVVKARKEEEFTSDKNRKIAIEQNYLKNTFIEGVTENRTFLNVKDLLKYVSLSGREAIENYTKPTPATILDDRTISKKLDSSLDKDKMVVRKPTNRVDIKRDILVDAKIDDLITEIAVDKHSTNNEEDIKYIPNGHRKLPEIKGNVDNVRLKNSNTSIGTIKYEPEFDRTIEEDFTLNNDNLKIDKITDEFDWSKVEDKSNIYKPNKNRVITVDKNILKTRIGVDEILAKQESKEELEKKKMVEDYKHRVSERHKLTRHNIENNIFDPKDPIQVSREKEIRDSGGHTKSSGSSSDGSDGSDGFDGGDNVGKIGIEITEPENVVEELGDVIEDTNDDVFKDVEDTDDTTEKPGNVVEESENVVEDVDNIVEDTDNVTESPQQEQSINKSESNDSNIDLEWDEERSSSFKEIDINKVVKLRQRSNVMSEFDEINIDGIEDFTFDEDEPHFDDVGGKVMPDSFVESGEINLDDFSEEEFQESLNKQLEKERQAESSGGSAIVNSNPVKMEKKEKTIDIGYEDLLIDDSVVAESKKSTPVEEPKEKTPIREEVNIDDLLIGDENTNTPIDTVEVGLEEGVGKNKLNPNNMTGTSEEKVHNILEKIFSEVDEEMGDLADFNKYVTTVSKEKDDVDLGDDLNLDWNFKDDPNEDILGDVDEIVKDPSIDQREDSLIEDSRTSIDISEPVIIEDARTNKDISKSADNVNEIDFGGVAAETKEEEIEIKDKEAFKADIINEVMNRLSSGENKSDSVKIKDALDTLTDLLKEKKDIPDEYREKLTTFTDFLKEDNLLIQDYDSTDSIGESVKAPILSYERPLEEITVTDEDISENDSGDVTSEELDKVISMDLKGIEDNLNLETLEENLISDLDTINQTTSMASQDTIDFVKIRQALDNMLKNSWEIELGLRFNFTPSPKVISKLNENNLEVESLGNGDCIVFYKKMDIKYLERRPSYQDFMTELKMAVTNLLRTAMKQKVRLVNKNFVPRVTEEEIKIMQNHLTKLKLGIEGKDLVLDMKVN